MSKEVKRYAERDAYELDKAGNYYCRHVSAMTGEGLHSKSDIAAELGWRDMQIDALLAERDALAAALKALRAATPSLTCESFHHKRRDLHGHDEECPPFERWIAAALACNAALQGEQP